MNCHRRAFLGLLAAFAFGCVPPDRVAHAFDAELQKVLAPSGKLKAGLYPGTPTSILLAATPEKTVGVGFELGRELARRLGVPYESVVFSKNAEVLDAIKSGAVDAIFTNASAARAREMNFGQPYLDIELGYLTPRNGLVSTMADIDVRGRRIGVTEGSSSDAVLSKELVNATVVRAETIQIAIEWLNAGKLDAFATNKATLFEMSEGVPGSRVIDGKWGMERHAIAIPKGREKGLEFIRDFTREAISDGTVAGAIARSGLRGATTAKSE